MNVHHVIVVATFKEWERCMLPYNHVETMQDNRGEIGIVQKQDVDEANRLYTEEQIFVTFLDVTVMRLESILLVKSRAHKNSSHVLASLVESQLGNMRIAYSTYQSVTHHSEEQQLKKMSSISDHKKKDCSVARKRKREKRSSGKKKTEKNA